MSTDLQSVTGLTKPYHRDMDKKAIQQYLAKRFFLEANYGILRDVAIDCKVSVQHVNKVFWGVRTNRRVRAELVRRGAPMDFVGRADRRARGKVTA